MIKFLTFDNLFLPLRHIFSLKLVVEWQWLSHFPAKMTLAHARGLLSIEKISYSWSSSSHNLKLSIGVWGTIAEIPYWQRATTLFRVALLTDWKFTSSKQKLYPDLGGDASQYGISALVPETSLREETIEGVAKWRLFSQANLSQILIIFLLRYLLTYNKKKTSFVLTQGETFPIYRPRCVITGKVRKKWLPL